MTNLKMYVSILLLVISTVGGGFYKVAVAPIKAQLNEQGLVIQEQAKEIGQLRQLVGEAMATNKALKSENEQLLEQLREINNQLSREKVKSHRLEEGLKEAKVINQNMSELLDTQNKKVKEMVEIQKKNKGKILTAQNKAKQWQAKYLTISRSVKSIPMEDCAKAAYLYDEYRKLRKSQ